MTREQFLARLNAPPPPALDTLADFLSFAAASAQSTAEVEANVRYQNAHNPRVLDGWIQAIEAVLADLPPPGTLARMVALDGNWVLPDETDAGAIPWLRDMAEQIKRIRASTPGPAAPVRPGS